MTSATKDHVNDHHPDTFSPQSQVQDVDSPITKQVNINKPNFDYNNISTSCQNQHDIYYCI